MTVRLTKALTRAMFIRITGDFPELAGDRVVADLTDLLLSRRFTERQARRIILSRYRVVTGDLSDNLPPDETELDVTLPPVVLP